MAEFDLDPLLRDLARDASRRASLADAPTVRRSGDQRRLAKGIAVAAGLVLVSSGAFGLMTKGMGTGIIAAQSGAASGSTAAVPSTDPTGWVSPNEPSVVPSWAQPQTNEPGSMTVTVPGQVPPRDPVPSGPVATGATASTASTTPSGTSSTPGGAISATPGTVSGAATTPGTSVASTPPMSPGPTAAPTTPRPDGSPTTTAPAKPTLSSYQVTLYQAVGGRVGERVSSGGAYGDPQGTLPYPSRLATIVTGGVAGGTDSAVAVGVAGNGTAHLTYFRDGKVVGDYPLNARWSDVQGLVAVGSPASTRVTVLAFHRSGTVSRLVVNDVAPGVKPTVGSASTVLTGLSKVTAASLANWGGDRLSAYVVSGDRLLLVTAPTTGTASATRSELVGKGLAGTTLLGRLSAGAQASGVVAWPEAGLGTPYVGADPLGPLSPAAPGIPLPR